MTGTNTHNFKINTSEGTSASNVFKILQDLCMKQYQDRCHSDTMQNDLRMFHTGPHNTTNTIQNTAQPATFFRTTTPSTAMTGTKLTTKQVKPVQVHPDTSRKELLGHSMHVHQPTVPVYKPGESLALRKLSTHKMEGLL